MCGSLVASKIICIMTCQYENNRLSDPCQYEDNRLSDPFQYEDNILSYPIVLDGADLECFAAVRTNGWQSTDEII